MTLLAIPNVSEGRDQRVIDAIAAALTGRSGARLLDVHSDADHNRTVFTATGEPAQLVEGLVQVARASIEHIDIRSHVGVHPHVGSLDVAPLVYTDPAERGVAAAAALVTADRLSDELGLPVFLYGILTAHRVTRAAIRRGGPSALADRIAAGAVIPDFGPRFLHVRAGATLVAARPPLIALNFELAAPATVRDAERIAARIRDGGESGLAGVRAIGVELTGPVAQVSTNIEEPDRTSPAQVLAAVQRRARVDAVEIVGLPPARHFVGFPAEIPMKNRRTLEDCLPS